VAADVLMADTLVSGTQGMITLRKRPEIDESRIDV
jgi:hypothetical protein